MLPAMSMDQVVHLIGHWMLAYGFALTRPMAMLTVTPLFVRAEITGALRGGVATALAMPMIPMLAHALDLSDASQPLLLLFILKEAALGAVIGLLIGIPLWSLDVAGDLLDVQRGASQGREADFTGSGDVSFTGTLLMLTGILLFVVSGGLQAAVGILYHSWHLWPALAGLPQVSADTPSLLLGLLDQVMAQAVRLVSPIILAMLLTDVGVILTGRIAPQLRIESHAITARNLTFFVVLPIYSAYMMYYMKQDFSVVPHILDTVGKALHATVPAP